MEWNPPGRRKRGRPNLTWMEGIRGLMGEKGLVEEDWNDRDEWRKKILSPALTRVQATSPTHTFRTADLDLAHTSPSYTNYL
jgi:hypothetical protein